MNPVGRLAWVVAFFMATGVLQAAEESAEGEVQWRWEGVPKIVAFGDVHGAHDELVSLLQATGVIDEQLHWAGKDMQVVSLGDLIDRGPQSRAVLDLAMRLQKEAHAAGGRFHVVVGNHELMNMMADFRYVTDEDFAAFANEESAAIRDRALQDFRVAHPELPTAEAEAKFLELYPPGYFGRRAAFAPTGRYGRWLLGLPLLIVIDDAAFVHGGLSPVAAQLGGAALNRDLRSEVRGFLERWHELMAAGVVAWDTDPVDAAGEMAVQLKDDPEDLTGIGSVTVTAAQDFVARSRSVALDEQGPLWYRGTAYCHPLLESATLQPALERLDASRVVVGHSPTQNRRIVSRLDERAILVDAGMFAPYYRGRPAALVIERGHLAAVYPGEPSRAALEREQPNVAAPYRNTGELEQLLITASVSGANDADPADRRYRLLRLSDDGEALPARFTSARGYRHEIAAYRLDQALGLGLVPAGVRRTVGGKEGALMVWAVDLRSETDRIETDFERPNWCAAGTDYELMYVFDALINNRGRTKDRIRYAGEQKRLWLADHLESFGTASTIERYLREIEVVIPQELADKLTRLDEQGLQDLLGNLLSKRQIRAILKRRNEILELWPTPASEKRR